MKILDVGCGCDALGEVNTDLFINDVGHRGIYHKTVNTKKTPNFILAEATHTPIKTGIFETVISRQVIEHLNNPKKLLDEMLRISSDKIIIECPFGLGDKLAGGNPKHLNWFSTKWFKKYALARNLTLTVKITKMMQNRIGLILNIPLEIRYTFQIKEKKMIPKNCPLNHRPKTQRPIKCPCYNAHHCKEPKNASS